jgi:hypothetical protein
MAWLTGAVGLAFTNSITAVGTAYFAGVVMQVCAVHTGFSHVLGSHGHHLGVGVGDNLSSVVLVPGDKMLTKLKRNHFSTSTKQVSPHNRYPSVELASRWSHKSDVGWLQVLPATFWKRDGAIHKNHG